MAFKLVDFKRLYTLILLEHLINVPFMHCLDDQWSHPTSEYVSWYMYKVVNYKWSRVKLLQWDVKGWNIMKHFEFEE